MIDDWTLLNEGASIATVYRGVDACCNCLGTLLLDRRFNALGNKITAVKCNDCAGRGIPPIPASEFTGGI